MKRVRLRVSALSQIPTLVIVDLARALAENTRERFSLIVPNDGAVSNFDPTAMVEIPCIVGSDGYEKICQGEIPQFPERTYGGTGLGRKARSVCFRSTISYQELWEALTL